MKDRVTALLSKPAVQVICLEKAKYELVRNSILKNLFAYGALTFDQLGALVHDHLKFKFNDIEPVYFDTVLQDLNTRSEIRCVYSSGEQLIEINL